MAVGIIPNAAEEEIEVRTVAPATPPRRRAAREIDHAVAGQNQFQIDVREKRPALRQ